MIGPERRSAKPLQSDSANNSFVSLDSEFTETSSPTDLDCPSQLAGETGSGGQLGGGGGGGCAPSSSVSKNNPPDQLSPQFTIAEFRRGLRALMIDDDSNYESETESGASTPSLVEDLCVTSPRLATPESSLDDSQSSLLDDSTAIKAAAILKHQHETSACASTSTLIANDVTAATASGLVESPVDLCHDDLVPYDETVVVYRPPQTHTCISNDIPVIEPESSTIRIPIIEGPPSDDEQDEVRVASATTVESSSADADEFQQSTTAEADPFAGEKNGAELSSDQQSAATIVIDATNSTDTLDSSDRIWSKSPSPPGRHLSVSPPRQRKISFADDHGLSLSDIRIMRETSDQPPVLSDAAWKHLHLGGDGDQDDHNLCPLWYAQFEQPIGRYHTFMRDLHYENIKLENVIVRHDPPQRLIGTVRVKNLSFDKTVTVRYTTDDWSTQHDHAAVYDAGCGTSDTFKFEIELPDRRLPETAAYEKIEFALCFRCAGGAQFWDNNHSANYAFLTEEAHNRIHEVELEPEAPVDVVEEHIDDYLPHSTWSRLAAMDDPYW